MRPSVALCALLLAFVPSTRSAAGAPPTAASQTQASRPGLTVTITVQETGTGIPGLPLRVLRTDDFDSGYGGNNVVTDQQGRAHYPVSTSGLYRVDIEPAAQGLFEAGKPLAEFADYYLPAEIGQIGVRLGEPARLDFAAVKGATITGRAVDEGGNPHAEAMVVTDGVNLGSSTQRVGADGRFTLRGASTSSTVEIIVKPKGYAYHRMVRVAPTQLNAASTTELPDVVVPVRSGQDNVRVTVQDDSGAPLKVANLRLVREDGQMEALLPVRQGLASAEIPPGAYRINNRTLRGDQPRAFELYEGQLNLEPGGVVEMAIQLKRRSSASGPAAPEGGSQVAPDQQPPGGG